MRATWLAAPFTLTSFGVIAGSPADVPDGGSFAKRAATATARDVIGSMRTLTVGGDLSTTRTDAFATVTVTGTSCGSERCRSAALRSIVAWRSDDTMPETAACGP